MMKQKTEYLKNYTRCNQGGSYLSSLVTAKMNILWKGSVKVQAYLFITWRYFRALDQRLVVFRA